MNPVPAVALMQAIEGKNEPAIDTLAAAISWANEPLAPIFGNAELFAHYNIQVEKARINAAGYANVGPVRPPYQDLPEELAAPSRECGRRWAQVCSAYVGGFSFRERPWEAGRAK
jgi:hypothetical protein